MYHFTACPNEPCIGIDLGTTNSCVGVWEHGRVEIIANDMGHRTTPSYVAFNETERMIGDSAMYQASVNPRNTIFDAKRLIGRKFSDATVQADMKYWPFTVVKGTNDSPMIEIEFKGERKQLKAEEISAMILTKMKSIAEDYLGKEVKNAVITVPAFFNDGQRQSTKDAGFIAGLNVLRIVSEPTAAALAYGLHQKETAKNILVFDLGGGTFDVTILTISDGVFEVQATLGDTHLGGEDFDNRIVDFFVKQIKEKNNKDISGNPRSLRRLRTACEQAKRALSSSTNAPIEIDCLYDNIDFVSSISLVCFEGLCHDYFLKCMDICEQVVRDSKIDKSKIDEIVLVGGSTRISKIQTMLSALFNGKNLNRSINADEAVAYGATVQAAILSDVNLSESVPQLELHDVTPLSLGIDVAGDVMSTVVKRNTTIPTKKSATYRTTVHNQNTIRIIVVEGERSMVKDNNVLGEFNLCGIPPMPRGEATIDVTFEIDANGILNVSAIDNSTGNEETITITNDAGRLSKSDIERMIAVAEFYKIEDEANKKRAKAKFDLESYCRDLKLELCCDETSGQLSAKATNELKRAIANALKFLDTNPSSEACEYIGQQFDLEAVARRILPSE